MFNCNLQWTCLCPALPISKSHPSEPDWFFVDHSSFLVRRKPTGLRTKMCAPHNVSYHFWSLVLLSKCPNDWRDIPKINWTIQIAGTGLKSYFSSSCGSKLPQLGGHTTWSDTIQLAVAKCHYTIDRDVQWTGWRIYNTLYNRTYIFMYGACILSLQGPQSMSLW